MGNSDTGDTRSQKLKEGEAHTMNQVSGSLLFHIIVIFIRVNLSYNKVL